jgi:predicted Zn finger-like uncharacterized protein
MAVTYTCPSCRAHLRTQQAIAAGKSIRCPKCGHVFAPTAAPATVSTTTPADKPAPDVFKLADNDPPPARPAPPPPIADDEDSGRPKAYGVIVESEEELERIEQNKPRFDIRDRFKRSARGPAQAMLVVPSNLLTLEGLLVLITAIGLFIYGMWPLVFNDAPPSDEEVEEAIVTMILGVLVFGWAALILYGASEMQQVGSYMWAMVGSIAGIVPLLVGLYGLVMLLNPKVKAGFEEAEAGPDDDEEDDANDEED